LTVESSFSPGRKILNNLHFISVSTEGGYNYRTVNANMGSLGWDIACDCICVEN
jgi:hypothetical protein